MSMLGAWVGMPGPKSVNESDRGAKPNANPKRQAIMACKVARHSIDQESESMEGRRPESGLLLPTTQARMCCVHDKGALKLPLIRG